MTDLAVLLQYRQHVFIERGDCGLIGWNGRRRLFGSHDRYCRQQNENEKSTHYVLPFGKCELIASFPDFRTILIADLKPNSSDVGSVGNPPRFLYRHQKNEIGWQFLFSCFAGGGKTASLPSILSQADLWGL